MKPAMPRRQIVLVNTGLRPPPHPDTKAGHVHPPAPHHSARAPPEDSPRSELRRQLGGSSALGLPPQPGRLLATAARRSSCVSGCNVGFSPLHGSGGPAPTPSPRIDAVRGRVCLLLPDGGGALWLAPGPAVRATVQRFASARGAPAGELALVAGGGRVVADQCATQRCMQLGTAVVLRLAWRARGGGCGPSKVVAEGGRGSAGTGEGEDGIADGGAAGGATKPAGDAGEVQAGDAGEEQAGDAGERQVGDAGEEQAGGAGEEQAVDAGEGRAVEVMREEPPPVLPEEPGGAGGGEGEDGPGDAPVTSEGEGGGSAVGSAAGQGNAGCAVVLEWVRCIWPFGGGGGEGPPPALPEESGGVPGTLKGDERGSAVGGAAGQGNESCAVVLSLGEVALVEGQAVSAVEAEGESRGGVEGGGVGVEGPPPHRPAVSEVEVGEERMGNWKRHGGLELEAVVASGAVALLSAKWVVALAKREGGVLQSRQALPDEAFLSLSQVQQATTGDYDLPVVCISHCWLQPDHPDPRGHNLRVVARALEALLHSGGDFAVFFDFCSMHQKCRGADGAPGARVLGFAEDEAVGRFASEDALFKQALGSLGTFYAHPKTFVFKLTAFPPDYDDPQRYERKGNVAQYADRGWCFCEASWAVMVKDYEMVLDIGKDSGQGAVGWIGLRDACTQGRRAPVLPSALEKELEHKNFTNGKDDRPAVAKLYAAGFEARFGAAEELHYAGLGWGDDEAKAVAAVLAAGAAPKLRVLSLDNNSIGDEGARALAGTLPSATALEKLYLSNNSIGDEGARALAGALPSATALKVLYLDNNSIGDEGARALAGALPSATALEALNLHFNSIGDEGARALAGALSSATALKVLFLNGNSIGDEAEAELRRACEGQIYLEI